MEKLSKKVKTRMMKKERNKLSKSSKKAR